MNPSDPREPFAADAAILSGAIRIAQGAGERLLEAFSSDVRPRSRAAILGAMARNDEISTRALREGLAALRPRAGWLESDPEGSTLPPGEWWVVDPVEGNINHVHGLADWGVSVTLIRDGVPALAVFHQPIGQLTYTALRGSGAHVNNTRLRVSEKSALDAAIVATGQAEAGQIGTYRRIGDSITAMLGSALLVRASVPSTFPMLLVAAGQNDAFWLYEPVLAGVAAGVLIVVEAGGVASRVDGAPWVPGSRDLLVAAPGVHAASVEVLRAV